MYETITTKKLSTGSIFKLIAIGTICSIVPISIFMGVFALFGANSISWNEKPITGVAGLAASPFIGLFISLVFTALLGTLVAFGLWVFSRFRTIQIVLKDVVRSS
jgi:Na+-transporting methylmalonyl-CoA/oxaloacetate decarboxylase beta subunit